MGSNYLGSNTSFYDNQPAPSYGGDSGAGMMAGGPAGAGIMVGGQFLNQYLAARAAEEENKKKMQAQAELAKGDAAKTGADLQNRAFGDLMGAWKQALTLR